MKIYIIGNPLIKKDSLPLEILPDLKKIFPEIIFVDVDPNEEFIPEDNSIIIDTVIGIKKVTLFKSINQFADNKKISPHDYDLGLHLKLLKKLKKLDKIMILGIPSSNKRQQTLNDIIGQLINIIST